MSISLFITIFCSISVISGATVMAAVCVNRGLPMRATLIEHMKIYSYAHNPPRMTATSEKMQGLSMALNTEFETLITQGE